MQGLQLTRRFYEECAVPLFEKEVPDLMPLLAFGLVGEGSECFGFDDEYSTDHDWGPGFCVWCPDERLPEVESLVEPVFHMLPETYMGVGTRMSTGRRNGRVGLFGINGFHARFTNRDGPPVAVNEWLAIPEQFLATCTNGVVFHDAPGDFTRHREALLSFYPRDVRLKKMAARCSVMAQSGQYNLLRSLRRNDRMAALLSVSRFVEASMSLLFLLSRRYMPFYKWAFRACRELPVAEAFLSPLEYLAGASRMDADCVGKVEREAEMICSMVAERLRLEGVSSERSSWLMDHAGAVQSRIESESLRRLPVQFG